MPQDTASEVRRHVDVIAPGRVRIVEEREINVDPVLIAAMQGTLPAFGMTIATDSGALPFRQIQSEERQTFKTRALLLAAKDAGIITGKEPWYRTEYMRLSQNERRDRLRQVKNRKKSPRARR